MKGSESREHRQEYSKLKMVLLYYGTYHNTINDKYHKERSSMEKVQSDVRTSPIVEKRTTGISIFRLYSTALYQREREDFLTVRRQCV